MEQETTSTVAPKSNKLRLQARSVGLSGMTQDKPRDKLRISQREVHPTPLGYGWDYYDQLVSGNGALAISLRLRKRLTIALGKFLEPADGSESGEVDPDLRAEIESFLSRWGVGDKRGLAAVASAQDDDYLYYGRGVLELIPAAVESADAYVLVEGRRRPRIATVRHISRKCVRQCKPKLIRSDYGPSTIDQREVDYPLMVYSPDGGKTLRFLKSFGDPDIRSKLTGEVQPDCPWEDRATEWIAITDDSPISPVEGLPSYACVEPELLEDREVTRYLTETFSANCIPDVLIDLVANIPLGDLDDWIQQVNDNLENIRTGRKSGMPGRHVLLLDSCPEFPLPAEEMANANIEMHITELNPLKDLDKVLDLRRDGRQLIAASTGVPQRMIGYYPSSGLGGAGEAQEQSQTLVKFWILPDQDKLHAQYDRILREGLGIDSVCIRHETPDLSDSERESQYAERWGRLRGLFTADELRNKIAGSGPLRQAMAQGENNEPDPGKSIVMPQTEAMLGLEEFAALRDATLHPETLSTPATRDRVGKISKLAMSILDDEQLGDLVGSLNKVIQRRLSTATRKDGGA